jgi:S-adenosylmethionine decarboxylase
MNLTVCSAGAGAITGFEGPEKRLEIDFYANPLHPEGFRSISRARWQEMCVLAKCNILNHTKNECFDSFVLSESSLFVYPTKVMIKTCGTTTLLNAIPRILEFAREFDQPLRRVQYSRKNFIFPKEQLFPHRDWNTEVEFLNTHFDGSSYVMGPLNGDHWCLYLADYSQDHQMMSSNDVMTMMEETSAATAASSCPASPMMGSPSSPSMMTSSMMSSRQPQQQQPSNGGCGERTLEIMMQDLDREVAQTFYRNRDADGQPEESDNLKYPGMSEILPGSTTDEYNFSPCGYSMNGLNKNAFYTIHVTPEPHCSYASFETNVSLAAYRGLVSHVLNIFKPGRVTLSFFAEKPSLSPISSPSLSPSPSVEDLLSLLNNQQHQSTIHTLLHTEVPGYILKYKTCTEVEGDREVIMCNYESIEFSKKKAALAASSNKARLAL